MTSSTVINHLKTFKNRLLTGEAAEHIALARAWTRVEDRMLGDLELVARAAEEMRERGEAVNISKIVAMDRYRRLLGQVNDVLKPWRENTGARLVGYQRQLAMLGLDDSAATLKLLGVPRFSSLPIRAVEHMVGLAADGSPLVNLLGRTLFHDVVAGITDALLYGTARGRNPRDVAREMARGSRVGLQRALVISRNEGMRVYREAGRDNYAHSGVVAGFRRLATKDKRTCVACLVADGEEYQLDTPLRAHVQCRCTQVPIVKGFKPIEWQTGATWLKQQDEDTQLEILGKGRFEAWKSGDAQLSDMVSVKRDETWGDAAIPTNVRDL